MNFFGRAVKNVTRKLSKTILLMLTFFVIGNFVIIGLSVSNAAESAKVLTRKKMRAVVTVSSDYEKMYSVTDDMTGEESVKFYKENGVKVSDIDKLLLDERVKTANATTFSNGYLPDDSSLDYVHLNNSAEDGIDESKSNGYYTSLIGFKSNYFPNMIEFEDGKYTITSGRFYTADEVTAGSLVCVVTEEFAELNSLRVGDTVDVCFAAPKPSSYMTGLSYDTSEVTMSLEVIGIYSHTDHITVETENYDNTYPNANPDNLILIPGNTLENAETNYQMKMYEYYNNMYPDSYSSFENYMMYQGGLNDVTLLLNDPLEVEQFVEDYDGTLGEYIKLDANNEEFNRLSRPLDTLSLYSNFIVWLVVINAVVIITLVTALTLKTREFEIGVLLSIGASKAKVIAQFFLELALIAIVAFTISIGTGTLVSKKVGQTVLEYQIDASGVNEDSDDGWSDYGDSVWSTDYTTDISMDDLVSEYDASVSPMIIGEIYVLGLGIVLISVLIPSAMIMRYNPKMILMGMN